jgi:hypothetical protein
MTLPNNGLIYIIIGNTCVYLGDTTVWSRDPIVTEIKVGSGPNGLAAVNFQILSYRTSDNTTGYYAFNPVPTGNYKLYLVASDDNPFDTANFGSIHSYSITNEKASFEWRLSMGLLIILFLAMLLD